MLTIFGGIVTMIVFFEVILLLIDIGRLIVDTIRDDNKKEK